jgi:hypothetical protein
MAQSDYRRRDQTRVSVARKQITPSERRLELRRIIQRFRRGGVRSHVPDRVWCPFPPARTGVSACR